MQRPWGRRVLDEALGQPGGQHSWSGEEAQAGRTRERRPRRRVGVPCVPSQDPLLDPGLCPSTSPSGGRRSLSLGTPKALTQAPGRPSLRRQPGSQTGENKRCEVFIMEITLCNNVTKPWGSAGEKAPRNNKIKTTGSL